MSVDAKSLAESVLSAAAEKGIDLFLPQFADLAHGIIQIGLDLARKGETKLADKGGVADPGAQA